MKNIIQKLNSRYVRLLAVLTLTLALFGVLLLSVGTAADEVYFTSINDKLLPLSEGDMPANLGGAVYVPYEVFHSTDIGISVFYSSSTKIIRISDGITDLHFDLKGNTSYDNNEVEYPYSAMTRNGKPYLPVSFVCRFFDLKFIIINTDIAPIVRITSGSERYDNTRFAEQANTRMQIMYDAYTQKHPSGNPIETPPPNDNTAVSLTFIGANNIDSILDAVTDSSSLIPVTFILTAAEINDNADAVRRAIGNGAVIAIAVDETNLDSEQLARAYLREVAEIVPAEVYTQLPAVISIESAKDALDQRQTEYYSFTFDTNDENWSLNRLNQLITNIRY
ncbi:MAG: hypothetical protein LBT88_02485 [Oscillospiraceae bacterium]|jgi:hypothetical protein|nr:hypothetical protein [Oscillospiraceae bacterium]